MKLRFWGVRGSIACPGPKTVAFGGNTPCLELRFGQKNRLIIIDAGTGIHPLGNRLVWDDIQDGPIIRNIYYTYPLGSYHRIPFFQAYIYSGYKTESIRSDNV